ncbi:MAG: NfeD family protein [Anaerolineae bacterium]|nr:NfeD family protein [Anaerolineae bacterium]
MSAVFGIIMAVGLLYFLMSIFSGGLFDLGDMFDGLDLDLPDFLDFLSGAGALDAADAADGVDLAGEARGFGCTAIAAFMASFGALGLVGVSLEWTPLQTLLVALAIGAVVAWGVARVLKWVLRQQSTGVLTRRDLVGKTARVTVNTPAGQTGEALVEGAARVKYPVKEVDGLELNKGDRVIVVGMDGGRLEVRKQDDLDSPFFS